MSDDRSARVYGAEGQGADPHGPRQPRLPDSACSS